MTEASDILAKVDAGLIDPRDSEACGAAYDRIEELKELLLAAHEFIVTSDGTDFINYTDITFRGETIDGYVLADTIADSIGRKRLFTQEPQQKPLCRKCKKRPCEHYGTIGGYSVQCRQCNVKQSDMRRAAARRKKQI